MPHRSGFAVELAQHDRSYGCPRGDIEALAVVVSLNRKQANWLMGKEFERRS